MLKIQNLSVSYGPRTILHNVSFDVQSGEVLALIGPNGAGKSTLIRAVSGVIPITSGQVYTNGDNFSSLAALQRARYIAIVPQAVSLPPAYTVWETVLFGRWRTATRVTGTCVMSIHADPIARRAHCSFGFAVSGGPVGIGQRTCAQGQSRRADRVA